MTSVSRSSSASSLEESPEYRAMRECYTVMVDLFKPSIESLGDALFAKELIPLDVKEKINTIALPSSNKTRDVINCIIGKVKHKPQVFHAFVAVLKEQDFLDVADELVSYYNVQTATPQPSTLPPSTSQSKLRLQYTLPEGVPSEVIRMLESVTVSVLFEDKVFTH